MVVEIVDPIMEAAKIYFGKREYNRLVKEALAKRVAPKEYLLKCFQYRHILNIDERKVGNDNSI